GGTVYEFGGCAVDESESCAVDKLGGCVADELKGCGISTEGDCSAELGGRISGLKQHRDKLKFLS
ncbi:18915_t:CDS:1, partial [Racocetra persica]